LLCLGRWLSSGTNTRSVGASAPTHTKRATCAPWQKEEERSQVGFCQIHVEFLRNDRGERGVINYEQPALCLTGEGVAAYSGEQPLSQWFSAVCGVRSGPNFAAWIARNSIRVDGLNVARVSKVLRSHFRANCRNSVLESTSHFRYLQTGESTIF
jgi:hypothetical protein